MPNHTNFLLGYGERLVESINPVAGGAEKVPPYLFAEARDRLAPMVQTTSADLGRLPQTACPQNEAVAVLTLHPQYLAKSYYPSKLLHSVGLEAIGSRASEIRPQKWTRKAEPQVAPSTDIFVAGTRESFSRWARNISRWVDQTPGAQDLVKLERVRPMTAADRVRPTRSDSKEMLFEVVLHASASRSSNYILEGFEEHLATLNLSADWDRRIYVGGLCFLPLQAPKARIDSVAQFSFLRVVREMPKLRTLRPLIRSFGPAPFSCQLPVSTVINPEIKVAVFDGGVSPSSPLIPWVNPLEPAKIGPAVPDYYKHGHDVTSALLFGPLVNGAPMEQPFAKLDHYRVLDDDSENDPYELYDVLSRIRSVLESRDYQFINLSIGPELPIDDLDVHPWTAYFDDYIAGRDVLMTAAVGNGGEGDRHSGNARIQVPADCVNALSIGAANSLSNTWQRASYSSMGPGRSPGLIKPDILAFGGSDNEPFFVVDHGSGRKTSRTMGTSFASPAGLRLGIGIRAYLGTFMSSLAIRTLLVHCSEDEIENRIEHGWGRIPTSLEDILTCPDTMARIVYQGELTPSEYVRAQIPLPAEEIAGMVRIRATLCYSTRTDPQDPSNYTRSGIDIKFRPHSERVEGKHLLAKTASFFQARDCMQELDLRTDAHKWETTLHKEKTLRGSSLKDPVFDIHYNAREEGGPTTSATKLKYALVVSVESLRTPDLYNRIVRRYATLLQPLVPITEIPIRTQT